MVSTDTIVAPATPAGESALAVVRVSGPLAVSLAQTFHRGRTPPPRKVWHGPYARESGEALDEAIFSFFAGPRSYTGEDVLEISCHGNPFIISRIIDDLKSRGCRLADPGEFTRRAFLNGRMDLTRAEAVMDVIQARSDRALAAAQAQLRGVFGRRIQAMVDSLLQCCAAIEAYIDFPEEDLPEENRRQRERDVEAVIEQIDQLHATERRGSLLRAGIKVVLLGEPNAGKSSLLNRLAGYERAIVSGEPGTTRDFLETSVLLGPHRIELVDTAGLRESTGLVEQRGVAHALDRAAEADICLLVVDVGRPSPALPDAVRVRLTAGNALLVVNKCDLPARAFLKVPQLEIPRLEVSALTSLGMPELVARLIEMVDALLRTGDSDERIAVSARHASALADSGSALRRSRKLLAEAAPLELVASEMHQAIDALGAITGRIDQEEVLDRLFSRFCIGK